MDGTLLGSDKTVSVENLAAVARLKAAGIDVAIASGRHHFNLLPFATALPVDWIVSAQGAEVSDLLRRTTLFQAFLDPAVASRLARLGLDLGYSVLIYAHEGIFTTEETRWSTFYASLSGTWPRQVHPEIVERLQTLKVLWLEEESTIARIAELPEIRDLGVYRVQTHAHIVEFLSPKASKAVGTAALAAHLGIPRERVIAFGDGENDIPLFQWAGLSCAMPHGWPDALPHATFIAPAGSGASAFARGVDQVLHRLGLQSFAA